MSNDKFGDDRLKKDSGATTRAPRDTVDSGRVNNDGGSLSAEERRKLLRQEWVQEVLPSVKAPEGWHYCWLSKAMAPRRNAWRAATSPPSRPGSIPRLCAPWHRRHGGSPADLKTGIIPAGS